MKRTLSTMDSPGLKTVPPRMTTRFGGCGRRGGNEAEPDDRDG